MRIAVVIIALLAGCASMGPKWTKEGTTSRDFQIADAQCESEAIERANAIATHIVHAFYVGCMKGAGWTPPPAPKEEEEAPKHAEKHDTATHDAPKHETAAAEAPKH